MAKAARRAAIYVRVSTDQQTVDNQTRELRQIAERRGWTVVHVYSDAGISGAKGQDQRPGLDSMLVDASRRKFDVDLYLDQQNLDTTTPMGKRLFQVTDAFVEFERVMIRQRVRVDLGTVSRPQWQVRPQGREGASAP